MRKLPAIRGMEGRAAVQRLTEHKTCQESRMLPTLDDACLPDTAGATRPAEMSKVAIIDRFSSIGQPRQCRNGASSAGYQGSQLRCHSAIWGNLAMTPRRRGVSIFSPPRRGIPYCLAPIPHGRMSSLTQSGIPGSDTRAQIRTFVGSSRSTKRKRVCGRAPLHAIGLDVTLDTRELDRRAVGGIVISLRLL